MSRGHDAMALLAAVLEELDRAAPIVRSTVSLNPKAAALVDRARQLVAAARRARFEPLPDGIATAPGYCSVCEAIHLADPEPEPHGARRSP